MKKALKWIGLVLGLLIGLMLLVILAGYVLGGARLSKTYSVAPEPLPPLTDEGSIERGMHWAEVLCVECHAEDLAGEVVFEDASLGTVNGSNLTTGEGGAAAEMTDQELGTAIRHGVDHDGRGLVIMPSAAYWYLGDEDLGAILAYLRHVPPVDKEWEEPEFSFIGRVLIGLGLFGNVSAAEVIDHDATRPAAPPPGPTSEYGAYLARIGGCWECHGDELNGGNSPDPASPPAPNLTPGGHLGEWSQSDFFTAMRTGIEPDGEEMDAKFMPWEGIGQMTDDELRALWLYLQSLPPLEDAIEEPVE